MKDFTTAAQAAGQDEEEDDIGFTITSPILQPDGSYKNVKEEFWSLMPTPEQLALYMAAFSDDGKEVNMMAATIQFLRDVVEKPSYDRLMEKLRDRKDPTQIETLQEILEYLFEQVADRPTVPSSGSSPSRRPAGRKSMDHLPAKASTRSPSRRAASSTTSTRGSSSG